MRNTVVKLALLTLLLIVSLTLLGAAIDLVETAISPIYSGPSPRGSYLNEVEGMQFGYEAYKADMHVDLPTKNPDFFDALDGKNKLNKLYMRFGAKRDTEGKVLDPWGKPFEIAIVEGKVKVHSIGYDLYSDR